jgi:hypothetical protein
VSKVSYRISVRYNNRANPRVSGGIWGEGETAFRGREGGQGPGTGSGCRARVSTTSDR